MTFEEEWYRELGPEAGPPRKRAGYALPHILGRRQVHDLLDQTGSLALRALYASGIRESELKALKPEHIGERSLLIGGRQVPIDSHTAQALRENPIDDPKASLENPAALRQAYATHRLENGMDAVALHHILGNENPSTTLQYLHTAVALYGPAYAHCHPLAEKRGPFLKAREIQTSEPPDGDEHLPPGLGTPTREEVDALIGDDISLRLYYATGLRRNELLNVRHRDLNREEGRIFVRNGKEDKDRYVLLDATTARRIPEGVPEAKIVNRTPRQVDVLFHQAALRTGILRIYEERRETISLHCLRHSFATHCYLNGMPLATLKRLLGHGQLTTTALYLQCTFEHCQAVYPK